MKNFILLLVCVVISYSSAWSGHQCSVRVITPVTTSECVYKNINCDPRHIDLTCCLNKTVTKEDLEIKDQCCPSHDDNTDSMCNITSCLSCNATQICDYSGDTCYDPPPNNVIAILTLSEINRGSNTTESELTVYNDIWWTNTKGFNQYQLDLDILQQNSPAQTLTQCKTNVVFLKKIKGSGSYNRSFNSALSGHRLKVQENNFDQHFDHDDILKATIDLKNSRNIKIVNKSMSIHFDYEPPTHCSETNTCHKSTEPFSLKKDASKVPIELKWEGWSDLLSGIDHYILSIFKLFTDSDGNLREPLKPATTVLFSNLNLSYVYKPPSAGVYSFVLGVEDKASNRKYARQVAIYDPNSTITLGKKNGELLYVSSANLNTNHSWQTLKSEITVNWTNHFVNWVHVNGSFLKQFKTKPINGIYKHYITDNMDDYSSSRSLDEVQNINGIVKFEYGYAQHIGGEPVTWKLVSPLKENAVISFKNGTIHDNDYVVVWVRATDIMGNNKTDHTRINFDSTQPNIIDGTVVTFKRSDSFLSSMSVKVVDQESGINRVNVKVQTEKGVILWNGNIAGNKTARNECTRRPGSCNCGNSNLPNECYNFLHVMKLYHCSIQPPPSGSDILNLNIHIYNNANLALKKVLKIGPASSLKGLGSYEPPINIHAEIISPTGLRLSWGFGASCYKRTSVRIKNEQISGEIHLSPNVTSRDIEGLKPGTNYDFIFTVFYETQSSQPTTFSIKTDGDNPMSYIITVAIESLVIVVFLVCAIWFFKMRYKTRATAHIEKRLTAPPNKYTNQKTRMSDLQMQEISNTATISTSEPITDLDSVAIDSNMTINSEEQPTAKKLNYYESSTSQPEFDENLYEDLSSEQQGHTSKDLSRRDINLEEVVFNGNYSSILKGTITTNEETPVAVRIPNLNDISDKQVKEFEDLITSIMEYTVKQIGKHQNILNYIAQFSTGKDIFDEPPMLIMELCSQGSLNEWLQEYGEKKDIDIATLHQIGFGVASGMEYLKIRGIFHGNLCSENVLLTSQLVPKIKGFGPSITEATIRYQKSMSPEYLEYDYIDPCEAVDSWAYGIVLWEIFSPGKTPYDDISDEKLLKELKNGYRLPDSEYAPKKHVALMKLCWNQDKKQRPSFHDIVEVMSGRINFEQQENDELVQEEYYANM